MFTIDASVHINGMNPAEEGSLKSQTFLERVYRCQTPRDNARHARSGATQATAGRIAGSATR